MDALILATSAFAAFALSTAFWKQFRWQPKDRKEEISHSKKRQMSGTRHRGRCRRREGEPIARMPDGVSRPEDGEERSALPCIEGELVRGYWQNQSAPQRPASGVQIVQVRRRRDLPL